MRIKILAIALVSFLIFLGACASSSSLDIQKVPASSRPATFSCVDIDTWPNADEQNDVTIGEPVLQYRSYSVSPEVVVASTPRGLRTLPLEGWENST